MHKAFTKILEDVSKELGIEKEVKVEDYVFVTDFGEKDDFGMPFLPQLFIETTDGKVQPVLTQMPFNPTTFQPDIDKGKQEVIDKIKNISSQ